MQIKNIDTLMDTDSNEIHTRVLNCKEINNHYESHLEFTTIDDSARRAIKAYVHNLN